MRRTLSDLTRLDADIAQADGLLTLEQLVDAATEQAEAQAWLREQAHMRWAEAGGYAAGLARPVIL